MSDSQDSRSDAQSPREDKRPAKPMHEQLPLLGDDAWAPQHEPAPEPEREDVPEWLRPSVEETPAEPEPERAPEYVPAPEIEPPVVPEHAPGSFNASQPLPVGPKPIPRPDNVPNWGISASAAAGAPEVDAADEPHTAPESASDTEPSAEDVAVAAVVEQEEEALWPQDDPDFRPFAGLTPSPESEAAAAAGAAASAAFTAATSDIEDDDPTSPLLDRQRPPRERYVSRKAILWTLLAIVAVAAIAGGIVWYAIASRVTVPDFTGRGIGVAKVDAARAGVELVEGDRRFSQYPVGQVLEQSPVPGTQVRRGSQITVAVSAGSESFSLPDVTGEALAVAQGQLEARGLTVQAVSQPSDQASGTVIAMLPAPATPVSTGDSVQLTVAAKSAEGGLKAYQLVGRVFVIDPAPPVKGSYDISLEISRRLQALLEASDAKVVTTRSAAAAKSTEAARASKAQVANPNALIGLGLAESGADGITVQRSDTASIVQLAESQQLQAQLVKSFTANGLVAASGTVSKDSVLQATNSASVRVVLGSATSKKDAASFKDPKWADSVARAIYQTLGQRYGAK